MAPRRRRLGAPLGVGAVGYRGAAAENWSICSRPVRASVVGSAVVALVYIAAFAPDAGESVNTLIANPPPGAPVPPILPPQDGFLFLDREKFHASFAGDVGDDQAAFMADSQVPWGVEALGGTITEPAWRSKPSWYLVATDDQMIPPRRAAPDVCPGRCDRRRSRGQPLGLRLPAGSRRRTNRESSLRSTLDRALNRHRLPAGSREPGHTRPGLRPEDQRFRPSRRLSS